MDKSVSYANVSRAAHDTMMKRPRFLGQPVREFSWVNAHSGGGAAERFISDIGGLLPIAL
ncbi:MAG: hypothetical protein RO009_00180 [Pseudorhodoplanes sp.]|jgi:hypothetical protein|nr:hypothetical protein [Pseudorhodoplanes sp.]